MFKKKFPSLSSLGSDGNTSFLRAARAGHLDKVLDQLDKNNVDINTSNANGLNALHLASKDGHVHVVTELLKRGANVDSATKKGNTALHIASLAGQEDVVRLLVDNGASVNVQSQNGFTPLYMAAQENHDNVVKFLLASGANQSLATEDGFTPLAVAMQQGHDKIVAVLLENDSRGKVRLPALHIAAKKDDCKAAALLLQNEHNPDVTSKSGFTPLHIASHYGNEGIANLLLTKGADVNYSAKHNITPLHVAAKWGKSNMVSLLLEKGANIESKTRDGLTPLHCAARSGHEQVVDMLLERGAPISSKTKNGLAPLHMSSQGDHVDAARILLYHRAPVDEVTVDYLTALHVAAHCGHARVAKLLLDRKADPNARALNGFTPLHIACKKNRIKVVELLLKHGASIEATTESGLTPLHVASFMGCMNIVIYLLQNEANPDVPTVRGETPLHLAARANQTDIIRILLRNGAQVDARAREQQTPLHIAARLGNFDIVTLLLQHGAAVDSTTKDLYTALHIATKEGQDEVASVLIEHAASLTATTKKGFTPLHLAAKYGNIKVARLLLQRDAPVDAQGKNGVTPLHVASHYDHQNVALLLLEKGASPHATAKNGHTPLHIAAKKNQMDIATTLLEYGAKSNSESKAGFTPLHLSSQEGHTDMSSLLIDNSADTNKEAKNGLTPLHLCAQEDRVEVAAVLVENGAKVDSTTKAGYTPLHVASHFGQLNMVRLLVQRGSDVGATTAVGYTPLHQAAQQGHATIASHLLENGAPPNQKTNQGQTALSIAQKLGYISVVETLKGVTEPSTITAIGSDEKYKVVSPETMQETFMSDSEDEGGEDTLLSEQPYRYLTVDEMKSLGDDSLPIDVTRDERFDSNRECMTVPPTAVDDTISPQHQKENYNQFITPDNVDIAKHPLHVGFLVSFLVDARGGAMRGCRHSGVRVIVPPRRASMPMRVTCRYLKRDKLTHPPPLMEGEALASRILELGPVGAKFLGPVMIEVPHFGSLRGKEREIVILRSDNGETWREHTVEATDDAVQDVLSHSFEKEEMVQLEEGDRTTRILTTDFPHYFAVVTRVRQEVHAIGPEGGMVSSSVVPQVQAVFPQGALTKKIKVGLQAQPIPAELAAKLLGNRVAVSPIVTVEPRRRKFHKPITLTIPVPQAANKGMINQYSGDAPTLRLLCSITGGTTRAQWEDVTGSTPLTFVNDCVSFTTTVSARFWLMDCRNIGDATKMATELYREAIHVPFMAKFVVFAKRIDVLEARLRVFCMTDDKEDKTLEHQEHFTEVAKSRDVEVLEGKSQYVEFAANLVPVTKSGEQLQLGFRAFRENRLPFTVRVKDPHAEPIGRTLFMREPKIAKGEPPQQPICVLNIVLPEEIIPETSLPEQDLHKYSFIKDSSGLESYQRADLRLSDISNLLGEDWLHLAEELGVTSSDINRLKSECPGSVAQQGLAMLRFWVHQADNKASANTLEAALSRIGRDDIVQQCIYNVDQNNFELLKEDRAPSRDVAAKRAYEENIRKAEAEELRRVQERILQREGKEIEKDDKEESKYVAEEKEVEEKEEEIEEVKKSVSERRKEIEMRLSQEKEKVPKLEKRLSQETKVLTEKEIITSDSTKISDQPSEKEIAEEKKIEPDNEAPEPAELSFAEKRLSFEKGLKQDVAKKADEKPVDSQKFIFEEQKVTVQTVAPTEIKKPFEQEISGKAKETTVGKPATVETFESVEKRKTTETIAYSDDKNVIISEDKSVTSQRRDSQLMEGVTERLGMAAYAPQPQDLLSPKVSKTPPPSPAEFKDTTAGTTAWEDTSATKLPQAKSQTATDWANKTGKQDAAAVDHKTSTSGEITSSTSENMKEASLLSSKLDNIGTSVTTKSTNSEHITTEDKIISKGEIKHFDIPQTPAQLNSKFIKEEITIIEKPISDKISGEIKPILSETSKNEVSVIESIVSVKQIEVKPEIIQSDLTKTIAEDAGQNLKNLKEEKQQSISNEVIEDREKIFPEGKSIETIELDTSFNSNKSSDLDDIKSEKSHKVEEKQMKENKLEKNLLKDESGSNFLVNERASALTSVIEKERSHPLHSDTESEFLRAEVSETVRQKSDSASRDEKLTNIMFDMLIDQETSNSQDKLQSNEQNLETKNELDSVKEQIKSDDKLQQSVSDKSKKDSSLEEKITKPDVTVTNDNVMSFVTTPTMQRKKIGGSQRYSREERPAPREVTHSVDYSSSEESEECDDRGYTVTEPIDLEREKEYQQERKVTFKFESEDDSGEEKLEEVVGVEFEEVGDDEIMRKQEISGSKNVELVERETVSVSGAAQGDAGKPSKLERRFERMASETMEQTPESTVTTEGEFQRMVSQLSTEEVDEYLQLWDEGGLTPSSELDSRDATVESADLEDDIEAIPQESSWSVSQEQEQRPTDTSEFFPKPPPRTTSKPEPCIENSVKQSEICQKPDQEDAQDYSVSQKKKFWEQISTSGEGADSKSSRQPESTVPPPVPRPRSSIVSTVSLLKSEAESDTETTNTTSDSTIRLKNVQQDALSKHSFTGSSDASDKEEVSEADATESILPTSVPATVSSAVVESTEQDKQPIQSSSSDSESEKNLKSTDKPSPARKSLSLDTEKKSKIPVVATRKTVYERSVSLPTSDLDASISSVRAKKRYFEAQIKKEMVVDQLMTQLEEESSPEHKSINQKEHDKPTADPEAMVSRQIHSHIFSHELDEQIESLVPESKHILEAEEAVVGKPVTVTEVAETNNKVDARRTVKRTDSTLFEAEIVKLEPVIKEAEEESQITSDNVITNNVKNMRNIFEKFPEQQSIDKSIKEPAQYSPIESEIIFDQQNICNDHIGDKTSASISSMPETLQFKSGEFPNQISDSMEMHIDKSEIEESEKEKDNEESLKLAEHSNIVSDQIMPEEDEPIPSITVTLSGKQRTDSYSPGDSEDNESEADNVPEHFSTEEKDQNISQSQTKSTKMSSEKQEPCVHTPEEHIPDTVWEVPVQQEPETSEQEITHDIPIESQIIIEKDEEDSSLSDVKQFQNILNRNRIDISEEEAREIAQQVVEDIETKIAEKNIIIDSAKIKVDSSINKEVTEYFKQSAEEVDEKIIESVIAKKQREQIMKATRRDTTTSSMEITDEDLRSSGVDTDTSLIDSFSSKLKHLDERSGTDEACHLDNMRTDVGGVLGDKEVLEKTLAEVKESLEAAQEELIEEHKKKQDKIDKKESPSEFEFKVMAIDRLKDESILECNNEDVLSTCDSEELVKTMSAQINSKSYGDETVDLTSFKEDLKGEGHAFDLGLQFGDKKSDIAKDIFIPEVQRQDLQDDTIDDSKKFKPKDDFPSSSSPILTTEKSKEFVSKEENYENTHSFEEQQKFELTRESHKEEKSEKKVSGHNYTSTEKLEFPSKKEKIIEAAITGEHKGFESEKTVSEFQESHNFIENEEKSDSYISERLSEIETQEHESNVFESSEQTEISLTTQESCETGEKQNIISNVHSEYPKFSPEIAKEEMRRTFSDDSQKSSQDESIKSPVGVEDALSSSSSSGRKGDSDTMHTLGKPGVVMRKHKTGISSAERVSSKHERRSGTDYEPYSSSGESHYQSFEQTSESIRTPSRPCSSDIEGLMVGVAGTTGSSEYESAISHEVSARSGTSHEFHTAVSSLSSRESMKSLDSESSGNLASVEISSEASETLVPSAMELERDMEGVSGPVSDYYTPPSRRFTEPYEMDIPHHVIRGESPHNICSMSDEKDSASFDNSADDLISEEDIELEKDKTDDGIPTKMKRSHEMIFLQDSRPASDSPVTEITDDKLASSLEEGTSVISSMSSVSENAVKTVLEVSRTESDKMDGSVTSDQLSLTVSGTSEQLSLSSESHDEPAVQKVNKIESSTSTQPTTYTNSVSSVTITTSMIKEQGIQSVCTQVTSQSESSKSEDIIQTEQISSHSNGPAAVEYKSEYDDIKETRRKPGHRRNESTTFKPSMIPILNKKSDSKSSKPVEGKLSNYIIEDTAESDKYGTLSNLTTKEGRNDEKKDIDESEKLEEESYQTEADQGFHREMREARLTLEDSAFCTEDEHEDIKDISASRLQSQISKSDSEGGQRHMSSEISDDRPDSELIELMKQCSSDATIDDPIERPRTPEPPEEPEIKDDTPEFSSEAQASITELELEYCGAFSRSVEYEAHISPIHEKPYISFEAQEHQDDMAEAEAAFHMVPHVSPTIPSVLPPTIPEDPIAEKHELETREIALKEEIRRRSILAEATSPGSIPDITVTQHLAPLIDREFHYPDLELEAEEVAATSTKEKSTPDTPASLSSKASTESEADQGREYIIDEPDGEDYIAEEPDTAEFSVTTEDKTEMETKHETIIERDSATNSPGSDSFELLEKPDLADDFVIIEEVGKEAQEQDVEGKSVKIGQRRVIKKSVPDDDIKSPPKPATKMTDLKYYPPVKDDLGPFPFESESPPTGDDVQPSGESEEGSPPSDEVQTYENEVEAGKKWIEMQFQGEQAAAVYGYEFEHGPLEDIKEEEATDFESSSKIGSVGSQVSHSVGSFGSVKESLSSTPDYDVLAGRKYFTRSGEHDDVSMSSLQEFERIEHMIALESTKNKSLGSQDSLSGSGGSGSKKHGTTRSGGDDISLSSLKEFEGLEMACIAAERIESKAKEEEALLSEIEEGHESQASESESCETISAGGIKGGDSDSDDYEKRMFEIDEIIRQAQTNVERFTDVKDPTEVSFLDKTESVGRGDSLEEVAKVPDLDLDQPLNSSSSASKAYDSSSYTMHWVDESRQTTDSLDKGKKLKIEPDQFTISTDSLDMKTGDKTSADAMSASTDSIEYQLQQKKSKGRNDLMTDSIELSNKSNIMSDSLDLDTVKHTDSIEDDDEACGNVVGAHDQSSSSGREGDLSSSGKEDSGEHNRIPPPRAELMLGSTDSLEPTSSTATHATYHYETDSIMSSSFTSGGSNTMVSSTETLDAAARAEVWFEDGKPYVTEVIEPETDGDFSHIIHRTVELPPEIHKVTFQGPDADKALREYVDKFGPGEDMSETQHVDEHGNVHIKRVVQRRVVIKPEQMTGAAAGLSGPELEQYIKHLSEEQMLGEMEPLVASEEQSGVTESDYSHLLSSATSPPDSSESHQEYFSRHVVSRSTVSSPSTSITTTKKEISLIQQKGEKSPSGEIKATDANSGLPGGTKEGDESPDEKVALDNSSTTDKLLASGGTGSNTASASK